MMTTTLHHLLAFCVCSYMASTVSLHAADPTMPGELTTPLPTINHLAIEWQIEGDDDLDATCEVKVRKDGETAWRDAESLRRVPAGKSQKTSPIFTWTNRLSGSVFDLEAGTSYEIELKLHDPDGGSAKMMKRSHAPAANALVPPWSSPAVLIEETPDCNDHHAGRRHGVVGGE